MREGFEFPLDRVQSSEHRHALGKYGAARKREAILRQISCSGALGDDQRAVVERVQAGENLHQRGFARAVRTHQADAVVGRDKPVSVFKKKFVAETFSGAGELNHGLDSSSHKTAVASTQCLETNQECAAVRPLRPSGCLPHSALWKWMRSRARSITASSSCAYFTSRPLVSRCRASSALNQVGRRIGSSGCLISWISMRKAFTTNSCTPPDCQKTPLE